MNGSRAVNAIIIAGLIAGIASAQEIHLKTRDIPAVSTPQASPRATDTHQLIQFDHTPSVEDLDALLAAGATVVSVVPDNAVVVSSPGAVVQATTGIRTVIRIDATDKLSPTLTAPGTVGPYTVIVEFHADVTVNQQNTVAQDEGVALVRPAVLSPNHAIAVGVALTDLQALAAHDEVAYIFPADPTLLTDSGFSMCAGMLTLSGPIAQYSNLVHGWTPDADGIAHLGYVFGALTTNVTASLVESEIVRALNSWSQYTNVAFTAGTNAAAARTIAIKFASGAHGDAYPFDSEGAVLAHTFYPVPVNPESIAGDMHLNADENWHVGGDLDIYSVALHEAGHAIGLGHSDKPGDVMYPYYRRGMTLSANDIGAAQALYGTPAASAAPVTAAPATPAPTATPTPAALHLTLDSTPASTTGTEFSTTGTVSGGTAPYTVQWLTDHGYSGKATFTSVLGWTASGISMVNGENAISVTVFDANRQTATQTASVTLTPATTPSTGTKTAPVTVSISTPSATMVNVNASTFSIAGTASGGAGITKVTWQSSTGCTGTATGTSHWMVSSIPLLVGTNTIIVRAYDANGLNAWSAVVAVRN